MFSWMFPVKFHKVNERVISNDVCIQDKEGLRITHSNLISKMIDSSCCAKWLKFLKVPCKELSIVMISDQAKWLTWLDIILVK